MQPKAASADSQIQKTDKLLHKEKVVYIVVPIKVAKKNKIKEAICKAFVN